MNQSLPANLVSCPVLVYSLSNNDLAKALFQLVRVIKLGMTVINSVVQ